LFAFPLTATGYGIWFGFTCNGCWFLPFGWLGSASQAKEKLLFPPGAWCTFTEVVPSCFENSILISNCDSNNYNNHIRLSFYIVKKIADKNQSHSETNF
jgi:hypothetical protein